MGYDLGKSSAKSAEPLHHSSPKADKDEVLEVVFGIEVRIYQHFPNERLEDFLCLIFIDQIWLYV